MKPTAIFVGESSLLLQCMQLADNFEIEIIGVFTEDPLVISQLPEKILHIRSMVELQELTNEIQFDYLFSVVNPLLVPERVLQKARKYAINYHDSLLPSYAGSHAVPWAIINGEKNVGVTWHLMTSHADNGDILLQKPVAVSPDDTVRSVNSKCGINAVLLFKKLLKVILNGDVEVKPQNDFHRSFYFRYRRPMPAGFVLRQEDRKKNCYVRAMSYGGTFNPIAIPKTIVDGKVMYMSFVSSENGGSVLYTVPSLSRGNIQFILEMDEDEFEEIDNKIFSQERFWMNILRSNAGLKRASIVIAEAKIVPEKVTTVEELAKIISKEESDVYINFWLDGRNRIPQKVRSLGIYEEYLPLQSVSKKKQLELSGLKRQIIDARSHMTFLFDIYDRIEENDAVKGEDINILITDECVEACIGFDYILREDLLRSYTSALLGQLNGGNKLSLSVDEFENA